MLKKRIIPCLDVKEGRTVKGVNFENLRDAGDAVGLARRYAEQEADELVLLDITATNEGRSTFLQVVEDVARAINLPFTVGGGIREQAHVEALLNAGADKVSLNTAAVRDPALIDRLARAFGSQCIVVAIDANVFEGQWRVATHAGQRPTERGVLAWAREAVDRGAGELLLTSMQHDGTRQGFALELTDAVARAVGVPVIASGGAGHAEHFATLFETTATDAALAAGIFHYGDLPLPDLKAYLHQRQIPVRWNATTASTSTK